MAGRIGIDNKDGVRLLHRFGEDDGPELDRPESSCTEVRNGQVEMQLLWRPLWPFWWGIRRCTLEGQLERRITGSHLAPLGITAIQLSIQELCVEGRKT